MGLIARCGVLSILGWIDACLVRCECLVCRRYFTVCELMLRFGLLFVNLMFGQLLLGGQVSASLRCGVLEGLR